MFCVLFCSIPALAEEEMQMKAGFIKKVAGEAFILREARTVAQAGDKVLVGDVLLTGNSGSLSVIFEDGTRLTLDEKSEVQVEAYTFVPSKKMYKFTLFLRRGSAIYSGGKLGKLNPDKVKLRTPRAIVGIRGTKLLLSIQ